MYVHVYTCACRYTCTTRVHCVHVYQYGHTTIYVAYTGIAIYILVLEYNRHGTNFLKKYYLSESTSIEFGQKQFMMPCYWLIMRHYLHLLVKNSTFPHFLHFSSQQFMYCNAWPPPQVRKVRCRHHATYSVPVLQY